jgi:predicted phosphodiesterase
MARHGMMPRVRHEAHGTAARSARILLAAVLGLAILPACAPTPDFTEPATLRSGKGYPASEPLFVFAVLADCHIPDSRVNPPGDDYAHLKALSIAQDLLANCVEDINNHVPPVDFTLVLGDMSDQGKAWELERAAQILGDLDAPYYPVVGNHDNFQDDDKRAWKNAFGYDSTTYTFEYGGFNFIVIDPTLDPYDPPDHVVLFDEGLRDYVRSILDREPLKPTFLINHYPLLNRCWDSMFRVYEEAGGNCLDREERLISEDTPPERRGYPGGTEAAYYRCYEGGAELRSILETHGNVVAAISGHVHANRMQVVNGITYIDVGATLVGKPSVRYFYVYDRRIEVDFEYISNDTLRNHVEGMCPRCRECSHPNQVCRFINGDLEDRRFTVFFYSNMPLMAPQVVGEVTETAHGSSP